MFDMLEWEKQNAEEQRRKQLYDQATQVIPNVNPELQRMIRQVKEVLPMVPNNVIQKDLCKYVVKMKKFTSPIIHVVVIGKYAEATST